MLFLDCSFKAIMMCSLIQTMIWFIVIQAELSISVSKPNLCHCKWVFILKESDLTFTIFFCNITWFKFNWTSLWTCWRWGNKFSQWCSSSIIPKTHTLWWQKHMWFQWYGTYTEYQIWCVLEKLSRYQGIFREQVLFHPRGKHSVNFCGVWVILL